MDTVTAKAWIVTVGGRHLTLSIFKQLDEVSFWYITPFGRVRTGIKYSDGYATRKEAELELVGHDERGILVKSVITTTRYIPGLDPHDMDEDEYERHKAAWVKMCDEFRSTPLILQGT